VTLCVLRRINPPLKIMAASGMGAKGLLPKSVPSEVWAMATTPARFTFLTKRQSLESN
jgi:hypothetical protein